MDEGELEEIGRSCEEYRVLLSRGPYAGHASASTYGVALFRSLGHMYKLLIEVQRLREGISKLKSEDYLVDYLPEYATRLLDDTLFEMHW